MVLKWVAGSRRLFQTVALGWAMTMGSVLGQAAPVITSVTPADGAEGVGTNSAIVFVFDQEMDTMVFPIGSVPQALIGNFEIQPSSLFFSGSWGADKRTLTLTCTTALPFDTEISWTLNPPGESIFGPLVSAAKAPVETVSGSFRTGENVAAGPAPVLVTVTPENGAVNVPPSSELVFVFDRAMDTSVSLGQTFPGNFEIQVSQGSAFVQGSWGSDGRSLTLKPIGTFQGGTTVSWTLNPAGTTAPLTSGPGRPLETTSGSFQVISNEGGNTNEICNPGTTNVATGYYSILKSLTHDQISATEVVPGPQPSAVFSAFVRSLTGSQTPVTSASITFPDGTSGTLTNQFGSFGHYGYMDTDTALDAAFPPGTYVLRFSQSGGGEHAAEMNMPPTQPAIPTILNYAEGQEINAEESFTLRWNAFTPLPASAYIIVSILDEFGNIIFQAPNLCLPRELPPTATSVVIPANYFRPGQRYNGYIYFGQNFYISNGEIPEMQGNGFITRSTSFTLQAAGGGGTGTILPARFLSYRVLPNGHPEMTISGTASAAYTVQRSAAVTGAAWADVGTITMDAAGSAIFEDTETPVQFPAFYRVVGQP